MKKIFLFLFAGIVLGLTGCLETTEEITLNEDGSGIYVSMNDMSKVIPAIKNFGLGGDATLSKAIDTSVELGGTKESIEGLSEEDVALLKKGTMKIKMNMDDEIMKTSMSIPFTSLSELPKINKLTAKSMTQALMSRMQGSMPAGVPGMDQLPEPSSIASYYTLEYEKGEVKRKLNKEKYANVASDTYLSKMQEGAAMGIPITNTIIINLPKPAEKLEGKNAKLSDDKKKVTVTGTIDDFFDSPEKLEFKVKY